MKNNNICIVYCLGYFINQIKPIEPAVNPTAKKNANSVKSLGIEFTIRHI